MKINDDTDLANNSKIVDKLIEETGILEARKKILGENHPDTIRTSNNLSVIYSNLGNF